LEEALQSVEKWCWWICQILLVQFLSTPRCTVWWFCKILL